MTLDTIVGASPEQVSCDLGGETAILNLHTGVYYSLDTIGARIWALLAVPRTIRYLLDIICAEYEVNAERCERDVFALLARMSAEGLVNTRAALNT